MFLCCALSLAGLLPFSGFFAKFSLIKAGLLDEQYAIVLTALAVSILTLFSMTKIWGEAFWKAAPQQSDAGETRQKISFFSMAPIALLAGITVLMGLAAGPVFDLTHRAAGQLLNPTEYINAVLGNYTE